RPTNATDKGILAKLLGKVTNKTVTQFNDTLGELKEPLEKVEIRALLKALTQLLHDGDLHKGLEGLLSDLSELKPSHHSGDVRKAIERAQVWLKSIPANAKTSCAPEPPVTTSVAQLVAPLVQAPSLQPAPSSHLVHTTAQDFAPTADNLPRLLAGFQSRLR